MTPEQTNRQKDAQMIELQAHAILMLADMLERFRMDLTDAELRVLGLVKSGAQHSLGPHRPRPNQTEES